MKSKTKAKVSMEQLNKLCKQNFDMEMKEAHELNDGFYNISYLVVFKNGDELVLKIAPPSYVEILTYEIDIMKAEVEFYKLVEKVTDIPVPHIVKANLEPTDFPYPYYYMTKIKGITGNKIENISPEMRKVISLQLAEILAKIHQIKGKSFGYISMEAQCKNKTYFQAFMVSIQAILKDGNNKKTDFPIQEERLLTIFNNCKEAFDIISEPSLVHFDLWDGNIFLKDEGDMTIEGIIDFERGFYGDPAADFSQLIGYIDLEKAEYFWESYNSHSNEKLQYNREMKIRTLAYRLYLFVIMHVECFYRDIDGSFEPQKKWVNEEIHLIYDKLKKALED